MSETDSRAAATTGEAVAFGIRLVGEVRFFRMFDAAQGVYAAESLAKLNATHGLGLCELVPLYAAPAPQVAALTEERDAKRIVFLESLLDLSKPNHGWISIDRDEDEPHEICVSIAAPGDFYESIGDGLTLREALDDAEATMTATDGDDSEALPAGDAPR